MNASGGGRDIDAIHTNVAAEIEGITLKATPVASDRIVLEDSADSFNKKGARLDALPSTFVPGPTPSARVHRTAFQDIPSGAVTNINFTAERWDNDNFHDNAVNNTRFTIRTAGKYVIAANVVWEANASGVRQMAILLNGTKIATINQGTNIITAATKMAVSTIWDLSVDDIVEVEVFQTTGALLQIQFFADYSPDFSIVRVGSTNSGGGDLANLQSVSLAELDSTSNVYATKDSLAIVDDGVWLVNFACELLSTNVATRCAARFQEDNTTDLYEVEIERAVGGGVGWITFSGVIRITVAGVAKTYDLDVRSTDNSNIVTIRNARITAVRMGS